MEEVEVRVDQLVAGGEGLARVDGIPLFIPRSAPGDRLRVQLTDRQAGYGRAQILEILEPGAGRREPPCPHFSRCGGCDLQHLEDQLQVDLKVEAMRETLRRLGGVEPPEVKVFRGDAWGYRLRTQLQVQKPAEESVEAPRARVGYHARGSHELVEVDRCPVLSPTLEGLLPRLPEILGVPLVEKGSPRRLDLAAGDGDAVGSAPVVEGLPHGELEIEVSGESYSFDARCFFQGHRTLLPTLVEEVLGAAPTEGGSAEMAYDLYSGVGLFSLPLARRFAKVVAVEGDRLGARYARKNARRAQLSQVEVVNAAVESWIEPHLPAAAARVVVDPPRDGLSVKVRRVLKERRPRHLTYVSCHAAALARDLKSLLQGGFELDSLTALDLFPQTGHLETVAQLRWVGQ
ncbi:MAG: class I SAM-dependent RNA methyltransferase [Acidobacteriota bacterium]